MSEAGKIAAIGIVLIPLLAIWLIALFHINIRRSDLSIAWKGTWSAVVILIPYLGVLIYAVIRPPTQAKGSGDDDPTTTKTAIDEIHRLVAEHEAGAISDTEFATNKAAIFGMAET